MAKTLFELSFTGLKKSKCAISIRMRTKTVDGVPVPSSPWPQAYIKKGPLKNKGCAITGCDVTSVEDLQKLVALCKEHGPAAEKGKLPNWDEWLACFDADAQRIAQLPSVLTWGELRATVKAWIAPGGPKAKDTTPFAPFKDKSYFGRTYPDAAPVKAAHLRDICLYTIESLEAGAPVARDYSSRGFYQQLQMINYLIKKGATPGVDLTELQATLKDKQEKRKPQRTIYLPDDADLQKWLDALQNVDPLRGWVEAMRAVYALRPHEIWHLMALPGQVTDQPTWIQVSDFATQEDDTKTGARFAMPCPEDWLERYQLLDQERSARMLNQLRTKHDPTKLDNKRLGEIISHWYGNTKDRFQFELFGWHQPPVRGGIIPKRVRGRCTGYSIRHAWAHRAKATTPWPVALKAQAMGHSEAVHTSTYLRNQRSQTQKESMTQLLNSVSNQPGLTDEKKQQIMALLNAA